jgi:hypothetical protein
MQDTNYSKTVDGDYKGFVVGPQAASHVFRWAIERWFWQRFAEDRLDGMAPPAAWVREAGYVTR